MPEDKKLPHTPALDEFMRLNPPARSKEEIKNYYSTLQIITACNDIATNEFLDEETILQILKGNQYDLVDVDGLQLWVTK